MSTRNMYVKYVYQSTRPIEAKIFGFALFILSYPRTLLEVHIRKNFGERYFSFGNAIVMFIVLAYIPYGFRFEIENISLLIKLSSSSVTASELRNLLDQPGNTYDFDWANFLLHNGTWYLFLVAFIYQSFKRYGEIKRLPSVFDLERCSVDAGQIHPFFENFRWNGQTFNLREIETKLEPLFFFIIALVLILFKQNVGYLILLSSFLYWYNYRLVYYQGDQFVMDTIDRMIFSEEWNRVFVEGKGPKDTRGVRFNGRKPSNPNARQTLADDIQDVDFVEVE